MRFSEAWLREFVDPTIDTSTLVHQLTMAGLEVDGVEPAAAKFDGVVVGEVVTIEPHPDADRLQVCRVDTGAGEPLQIVCGAKNVYRGMRVPTALVGAELPDDFRIKQSKLRGVESYGMLCSEKELGIADSADGLMELPASAKVGVNVREYLKLDDSVIEVDLTPNRADCLSIEGVAREVSVLNKLDLSVRRQEPIAHGHDDELDVQLDAPEACPRYLGRLIRNVDVNAETPMWMRERLRRSGHRSLGPLVDVTNYVLLELGQPLHAFDAAKISGGIVVRYAKNGEQLDLLNDEKIKLTSDTLVIADQHSPLALAGIMGGRESAVGSGTVDVFLECAFFSPATIMGKARTYGLHTESSHRFERGVDPQLQQRAIQRASQLIVEIAGGELGPTSEQSASEYLPVAKTIPLRSDRIRKLLGITNDDAEIEDILRRLGMDVTRTSSGWEVKAPSYRFDIAIEADLIEEIGRVVGYDNLPQSALQMHTDLLPDPEAILGLDCIKDLLVIKDYHEAITYSFVDPDTQRLLYPNDDAITLQNPISSELAVMRTGLWPGLLGAAQHNLNRQQSRVRLFESGLKFLKDGDKTLQQKSIAGLVYGSVIAEQWGQTARAADFFDVKADVQAILELTGRRFEFNAAQHSALHPGQCAQIRSIDGDTVGWLGMLHPNLEKALHFENSVFLFELDLDKVLIRPIPSFDPLSRFPSVRRDLAVIVDAEVAANDLADAVAESNKKLIKEVNIFDVYQGAGVESGRKSVALGLILQDSSRTLKDNEIDTIVSGGLKKLIDDFGAQLRE